MFSQCKITECLASLTIREWFFFKPHMERLGNSNNNGFIIYLFSKTIRESIYTISVLLIEINIVGNDYYLSERSTNLWGQGQCLR